MWTDVLHWHEGEVTIAEDGWADFSCSVRDPILQSQNQHSNNLCVILRVLVCRSGLRKIQRIERASRKSARQLIFIG